MKNYLLELNNLPRKLNWPIPLEGLCVYENATGTYDGIRPDNIEFSFRLESSDAVAVDIQNQVRYETPFPLVLIKLPGSQFTTIHFSPRRIISLIYDGHFLDYFRSEGMIREPYCWPLGNLSFIEDQLHEIDLQINNLYQPGAVDRLDILAWTLIHEALLMQHVPQEDHSSPDWKIQQIASYYRQHYVEKIDLKNLLRKYGLSRRTFYRYWSEKFRQSPKQLQLSLRLQEAPMLLSFSSSISEVAGRLGFTNVSTFIQMYRQVYGVTPGKDHQ